MTIRMQPQPSYSAGPKRSQYSMSHDSGQSTVRLCSAIYYHTVGSFGCGRFDRVQPSILRKPLRLRGAQPPTQPVACCAGNAVARGARSCVVGAVPVGVARGLFLMSYQKVLGRAV